MNWYRDLHKGGFNGVGGGIRNPVSGQLFDSTCGHCGLTAYYGLFQDPTFHECARLFQERDARIALMADLVERDDAFVSCGWLI